AGPRLAGTRSGGARFDGDHDGRGFLDAAATYLGLSEDALRTQLEAGKTLAQVAQAQGRSEERRVGEDGGDAKSHLDQAVASRRISAAQETQTLSQLKTRAADLVNGKPPAHRPPGAHSPGFGLHEGLDAAATYLGLSEDALRTQLEAGMTLVQVAQAQGKSVQGLEDAIVADAKSHPDQAGASGGITEAQETRSLGDLRSRAAT